MLVINKLVMAKVKQSSECPPILQTIILLSQQFDQIEFFHIYRHLNSMADVKAKKWATLEQGEI